MVIGHYHNDLISIGFEKTVEDVLKGVEPRPPAAPAGQSRKIRHSAERFLRNPG